MNKSLKIYIFILVLLFALITWVDSNRPKPIDWTENFESYSKTPFGLFIFNQEKEALFKDSIYTLNESPFEYFDAYYNYEDEDKGYSISGNFMAIDENYTIDPTSSNEILTFVNQGNTAFLSMKTFPDFFKDSLRFDLQNIYFQDDIKMNVKGKSNPLPEYTFSTGAHGYAFASYDTLNTQVLGNLKLDNTMYPNFIQVNYGKGQVLLHLQPVAFTNYYLLKKNNYSYIESVLSYIPKGNLYWYPNKRANSGISNSPLRFILNQPGLRWAWYLFLISMVIFMIFRAKRTQRIIPILKPLPNTTVEFIKTIGNLYYQEGNHNTMMEKKSIFFLEKIRQEYGLDTQKLDTDFCQKLHNKTGKDLELIEKAIHLIKKHRQTQNNSEADLIELNSVIEKIIEPTKK